MFKYLKKQKNKQTDIYFIPKNDYTKHNFTSSDSTKLITRLCVSNGRDTIIIQKLPVCLLIFQLIIFTPKWDCLKDTH